MHEYPKEYLESASNYLKLNGIDFSGAKILMTGASGFIGSWLIELLRYHSKNESQEMEVLGLSRNLGSTFEKLGQENFEFINWVEGGIENLPGIKFKFSHAIHCATPTTIETGSADSVNVRLSSVDGMQHLLDLAKVNGNRPRILHTSSGAVYGNSQLIDGRFPINQDCHEASLDNFSRHYVYAMAKRETELKLDQATKDGDVSGVNARLFAFFGPGLPITSQYAIGNLINQALNSKSLSLNGTGMATRSYLTGNAMAALVLFVLNAGFDGATHIGSNEGKVLKNWAEIISNISGKPLEILNKFDDSADKYVPIWDERIPKIDFEQDNVKVMQRWLSYSKANSKLD
jgi:nucleoside-diphosphate-sugar epimerase